jgi:hypothetical protein
MPPQVSSIGRRCSALTISIRLAFPPLDIASANLVNLRTEARLDADPLTVEVTFFAGSPG